MFVPSHLHRALLLSWAALCAPVALPADDPPGFSAEDSVSIRADQAWEDEEPDIVHFSGHFLMQAADWSVTADTATLYGSLDDPQSLLVRGAPAQIRVVKRTGDAPSQVSGTATAIEYQRTGNVITLQGGATLQRDDQTLSGDRILYHIDSDQYQASGSLGVQIEVQPEG